jgi:hypothetical protein
MDMDISTLFVIYFDQRAYYMLLLRSDATVSPWRYER